MVQLCYPHQAGDPNSSSLVEAQVNNAQFGACDRAVAKNVRAVKTVMSAIVSGFLKGKRDRVDFTIQDPLTFANPNARDFTQN